MRKLQIISILVVATSNNEICDFGIIKCNSAENLYKSIKCDYLIHTNISELSIFY